jgi:hypothetical protein
MIMPVDVMEEDDHPCDMAIRFAHELDRRARVEAFLRQQHERLGLPGGLHGASVETIQTIFEIVGVRFRC